MPCRDLTWTPASPPPKARKRKLALAVPLLFGALSALSGCGGDETVVPPVDTAADTAPADTATDVGAEDTAIVDTATVDAAADVVDEILGRNPPCTTPEDCGAPPGPCLDFVCHSLHGCVPTQLPDGALCDDGNTCALGATCQAGGCVSGKAKDCDDAQPCTVDSCANGACVHLPVAATPAFPCDDGNPCTGNDHCAQGGCAGDKNTCLCQTDADCKDAGGGDLCAGTWYCAVQPGGSRACVANPATIVACDPSADTPCQENICAPSTGKCVMKVTADGAGCDDGQNCTEGEVCNGGACKGGVVVCCNADVDCAKNEDGDACNGTLFCNKALGKCQLNPSTLVTCVTVDDTTCSKAVCDPKTGTCGPKATTDGETCDDGNPCTPGEQCKGGLCTPTSTNTCPCKADIDCAGKDDGDPCNGVPYCDLKVGSCKTNPATVVVCPSVDDTVCTNNTCDPKKGVCAPKPVLDGQPCDADGNPCTPNDACKAGACLIDVVNTCVCSTNADCAAGDDGDLCNGALFCDKSGSEGKGSCKVNPATLVNCPSVDNTACIQNVCQPKSGKCAMTFVNQDEPCDDGAPCTKGDVCKNGACKAGGDICLCHANSDCLPQEDGNACNGTLYCDTGPLPWSCKVKPSTVITCPTVNDSYCQQSICQPKSGLCVLTMLHLDEPCDDNDTCTVNTVCKGGLCADPLADSGGKCNDGNPCTDDSCDKVLGCQWVANKAPCEDGSKCTVDDACASKACKPGAAAKCDDGKVCTTDLCNPQSGCIGFNNSDPCTDGNPCTVADGCKGGACIAGKAAECADSNPCSLDGCDTKTGQCTHDLKADPAVLCSDGIPCTVESCDPKIGCIHSATDLLCDDKVACTNDTCSKQVGCTHLSNDQACSDNDACTLDTCVAGVGCKQTPSGDGEPCADADPCTIGDACAAGACKAGIKSPACSVDPAQCKDKADGTACNDGDACSKGETCAGGVCRALAVTLEVETLIDTENDAIVDGPRLRARGMNPHALALSPSGAIGMSSTSAPSLRELALDGVVRTIAGTAIPHYTDALVDGVGTAGSLGQPGGLVYGPDGSRYIPETLFDSIRVVSSAGAVTTLAGGAAQGFADGKGSAAKFYDPIAAAWLPDGALIVCDRNNALLRRVTSDGTVTTVAGQPGTAGVVDGKGSAARLSQPYGIARAPNGSHLFVDRSGHLLRRVSADGTVTTIAGKGNLAGAIDGKGDVARFNEPCDVAVAPSGEAYTVECGSSRLRRIGLDGTVTTLIGAAGPGYVDGVGAAARFATPARITFDAFGDLIIGDWANKRVRRVRMRADACDDGKPCTRDGCDPKSGTCTHTPVTCDDGLPCTKDVCTVSTGACTWTAEPTGAPCQDGDACTAVSICAAGNCYASATAELVGKGAGATDGLEVNAGYYTISGMRRHPDGRIAMTESHAGRIRLRLPNGEIKTIAGGLVYGGYQDGTAFEARFSGAAGIAFAPSGGFYVADTGNHRIRAVTDDGQTTTFAGVTPGGFQDGAAALARFNEPTDVCVSSKGTVIVADRYNHRVRAIADGVVTTLAGNGHWGMRDGPGPTAIFDQPTGLAPAANGDLYVADLQNHAVRRIGADGVVVTVVGSKRNANQEGIGRAGSIAQPAGVAIGPGGVLWVSTLQGFIGRVDAERRLTFVLGGGAATGGLAASVNVGALTRIAVLDDGELIVAANAASKLLKVSPPGVSCDDGNACTDDSCTASKGCVAIANGTQCQDDDPCTSPDLCVGGACKAGAMAQDCNCKAGKGFGCDDSNPCTTETCDALKGCGHVDLADYLPCNDNNPCTLNDSCQSGNCLADPSRYAVGRGVGAESPPGQLNGARDGLVALHGGAAVGRIEHPTDLSRSAEGHVYIADSGNSTVRVLRTDGRIDTVAGGLGQVSGSVDGTRTEARFAGLESVEPGKQGELFVSDRYNHTMRKIDATGSVTTLAGSSGVYGFIDGKGSVARFREPLGMCSDGAGGIYVADHVNHALRKVSADGNVATVAGLGSAGLVDGPVNKAQLAYPSDVALGPDGTLYFTEWFQSTLRAVRPDGNVVTLLVDGGVATPAVGAGLRGVRMANPGNLAWTAEGVVFTDNGLGFVRRYRPGDERVELLAGGGTAGLGVQGAVAMVNPRGVVAMSKGELLVALNTSHRLRLLRPIGATCDDANDCTLDTCDATKGCVHGPVDPAVACTDGGPCQQPVCDALLGHCTYSAKPNGTLCGKTGTCGAQCVHGQCALVGVLDSGIGTGVGQRVDGAADKAAFHGPIDITGGELGAHYVAEWHSASIRRIAADLTVTTLAGGAGSGYAEGKGSAAKFNGPWGISFDGVGSLYVSDHYSNRIRRVDLQGSVITVAGNGKSGSADGDGLSATMTNPTGIAAAADGTVYFSDSGNSTIRRLEGVKVTTIAGAAGKCAAVDGPFGANRLCASGGLALDAKGNLWIADRQAHSIRRLNAAGVLTTVGGDNGNSLRNDVDGVGLRAGTFGLPMRVAPLADGTVLVSTQSGAAIRRLWPQQRVETVAGVIGAIGMADGLGPAAKMAADPGLHVGADGVVWVADMANNRVRRLILGVQSCGELLGASPAAPATSCKAIGADSKVGHLTKLWIDPDPSDGLPAFSSRCDHSFDGGGWTRIDSNTDPKQVAKLMGSKAQVLYKCSDTATEGIVSPPFSVSWSWVKRVAVGGTWKVKGQDVVCGDAAPVSALDCGWGVGCAEADAKTLFVPGQTAANQCGAPGQAWTQGAMSLCGAANYGGWVVYLRPTP